MATPADIAAAMKRIQAANTGYSQPKRWSFVQNPNARPLVIVPNKAADCSSAAGAAVAMAGYPIDLSGTFWTGNQRERMVAAGAQDLPFSWDDVRLGDVLWRTSHTEVATLINPKMQTGARIDENGGILGPNDGNQGYEFPSSPLTTNWTRILRFPTTDTPTALSNTILGAIQAMKATHVIFQSGTRLYMASILAGTYTYIPNPQALKDQQAVIAIAGGKVATWQSLVGGKNNGANPDAFGKEIK